MNDTETSPESSDSATETTAPAAEATPREEPAKRSTAKRTPAKRSPAKRTPAKRSPAKGSSAATGTAPGSDAAVSLASALGSLVAGIEAEVKAITGLSGQIDKHVDALNSLREDATARLLHLDELQAAAADGNLSAFLSTSIQPTMPMVEEVFPDRMYGA